MGDEARMASTDALERGRADYGRRAWLDAFTALSEADRSNPLDPPDLELLAHAAMLIRHDDGAVQNLERAHAGYLAAADVSGAARCAIMIGLEFMNLGEAARANGWFSRAGRLLEQSGDDCVELGYLLVPDVLAHLGSPGGLESAVSVAADVARIGERYGDLNLTTFAVLAKGRARIKQGRIDDGITLLDEAMVAIVAGELSSPVFTGLIYCSVIDACQEVFDFRRAREWTEALSAWCAAQPQLVDFTGLCLVHRAECLQQHGAWPEAIDEARRAGERFAPGELAAGAAHYRQAEIHRLYGNHAEAQEAYRLASERGWQPQPGLALLSLAGGRTEAAVAAIRRMLGETTEPLARARFLPACVEILLAAGDLGEARTASTELTRIATGYRSGALTAMAATARGAVDLAAGDATAALIALREASRSWQDLDSPYEVARVRTLLGLACRALGDHDSAELELAAARSGFARLGAIPDLDRLGELGAGRTDRPGGLTPRELQVLRLIADGRSNKAIAAELVLSERTVDRHVSSILAKLGVPSRTAATAYAFAHQLV
jgi:DNA-binding CsgD family transcriptional regulator